MGMAASQARYLALVARKSNCEYEGQQINQARLALSNQSANLFNQMLGLTVPVPPSTQDFTKKQYSFSDGMYAVTLDSWKQLANRDENYNYVVTYHYKADVYTGGQKKMSDPQVQFSYPGVEIPTDYAAQSAAIQAALVALNSAQETYDTAKANYQSLVNNAKSLSTYADRYDYTGISNVTKTDNKYTFTNVDKYTDTDTNIKYDKITGNDGKSYLFTDGKYYYKNDSGQYIEATALTASKDSRGTQRTKQGGDGNIYDIYIDSAGIEYYFRDSNYYSNIDGPTPEPITGYAAEMTADTVNSTFTQYDSSMEDITTALNTLKANGAIPENTDPSTVYVADDGKTFAFVSDLEALTGRSGTATILPVYKYDGAPAQGENWVSTSKMASDLSAANAAVSTAKTALDLAQRTYDSINVPSYIGNCKVIPISEVSESEAAEITQIIKDMAAQEIETNLDKYYNIETGEYKGGIYSFTLNGLTYYTTYDDLADSARSGTGINHIDDQIKLPFYRADYISKNIEKTEKALLETDANGRFTSIRLEDDSVTYDLKVETITDEAAYEDAMNQYYYENNKYDKMVQDINAKTSLIHQEDKQLELRLKQLDTEQNALKTEMEAVQKVIKDNVDSTFKTFNN